MAIKPLILAGVLAGLLAGPAFARDGRHDHGDRGWHGGGWHDHGWHDHGHFHGRPFVDFDVGVWRHGYWNHGWHDGRFGWWWAVGPGYWYYYDRPFYPYPEPYDTTVIVEPQEPAPAPPPTVVAPHEQYWYYCKDPKGYYPYVSACKDDWEQVPTTPPGR
jgi:hypothetical protein